MKVGDDVDDILTERRHHIAFCMFFGNESFLVPTAVDCWDLISVNAMQVHEKHHHDDDNDRDECVAGWSVDFNNEMMNMKRPKRCHTT